MSKKKEDRDSLIERIKQQKEYDHIPPSKIVYTILLSNELDAFLCDDTDEVDEDVKPFSWVKHLHLGLGIGPNDRCTKDLRILSLFPNLRSLKIRYTVSKTRKTRIGDKIVRETYFPPLCFRGIENCHRLVRLDIVRASRLRDLRGVEYCERLQSLTISDEHYSREEPLDISAVCGMSCLKKIGIFWKVPTNTDGLDLSQCGSLKELMICPNTKDLEFLRGTQLVRLVIDRSSVESLRGLDSTKLRFFRAMSTKIKSLRRLRGAPLSRLDIRFTKVTSLKGLDLRNLVELKARGTPIARSDPSELSEQAPKLINSDIPE